MLGFKGLIEDRRAYLCSCPQTHCGITLKQAITKTSTHMICSNIPCSSSLRQIFDSIPSRLPSSLGLPGIGGASRWINISEVFKQKDLKRDVLPDALIWVPLAPKCSSLRTTRPSRNSVISSAISRFKFRWRERPSSTNTSAEIKEQLHLHWNLILCHVYFALCEQGMYEISEDITVVRILLNQ